MGVFLCLDNIYRYMNIRRIIREEMDVLQWIKDIKSNQDIAQKIADESEIKKNNLLSIILVSLTI